MGLDRDLAWFLVCDLAWDLVWDLVWDGMNLKKLFFSIPTFPEIKAEWSKIDQNQGFQNKGTFQIDPE